MTFDAWWNALTIKEQTVIGKNNARFVWQQACEACAKVCDANVQHYELHRHAILSSHNRDLAKTFRDKGQE